MPAHGRRHRKRVHRRERAAGSEDIVRPSGHWTAALTGQVQGIHHLQYTPIGNALQAAADSLPNEGNRSIILVSDGEDTCAPPEPREVARDLADRGVDRWDSRTDGTPWRSSPFSAAAGAWPRNASPCRRTPDTVPEPPAPIGSTRA